MKTDKRKRVKAIVSLLLAGAVALSMFMTSVIQADAAVNSDPGTLNAWQQTIGSDTRNVGRIWTDKTVSDSDIALTGNISETIAKGDSDFLIGYSALSSTARITGQSVTPLDIVLVLDLSGSMSQDITSYSYSEVYSPNTNRTYYVKVNGRWHEVDYTYGGRFEQRGWYYTQNYYRVYVTPKTSADDNDRSHVQFYTRGQGTTQSKISALKAAANGFIRSTERANANMPADTKHRISIVKFSGNSTDTVGDDTYTSGRYTYNYTQIVKQLTDCTGTGADDLETAINRLRPNGCTRADYAMEKAEDALASARDGAQKVVIFFTDGEPNDFDGFDNYVANGAITNAQTMKRAGTLIYTIGVFGGADPSDTSGRFNAYMHGVSSNYPNASSYNWLGERAQDSEGNPTQYYKAAADADSLNTVFSDIFSDITRLEAMSPTVTDEGNPHRSGYITYTDTLGDYMQVDDFKSIVFADTVYSSPTVNKQGNVTTYTFNGTVEANPIYPDGNLADIQITVTSSGSLQAGDTVTIRIPASMIPMRYYQVGVDRDGKAVTTITEAYPIRLFYGVSLKDEALTALDDPDAAMQAYIAANKDSNGDVRFYANKYTAGARAQQVYTSFEPALTNDFYYFQHDTALYTDPGCTQPARGPLDPDRTYYYYREYYAVGHSEAQRNVITIPGASNLSVAGYIETDRNGNLYVPAGSPRVTSLYNHALDKESNNTGTAPYATSPTWDNVDDPRYVNVYLGNNGVMTEELPGELAVTKTVTAEEGLTAPNDAQFTFSVTFTAPVGSQLEQSYTAAVFNSDGSMQGSKTTIASGGTFTLKAGQTMRIYGLEDGTRYTVEETGLPDGFTQTSPAGNASGTIASGSVSQAEFVNNYSVTPITVTGDRLGISGTKTITGRQFKSGDIFRFITSASGITPNAPLPTGATVDITPTTGASARIDFGQFEFTAPGQYRYVIYEYLPGGTDTASNPADKILPGMTYDTVQYRLVVDVADNGNGALSVSNVAISSREEASSGVWTELYNSRQLPQQDYVAFENTYRQQTAQVSLYGSKTLNGKLLTDYSDSEQFQFEIVAAGSRSAGSQDEFTTDAGQPMPSLGVPNPAGRYIYQNASSGQIVIPAIQLDYTMVGKEYKYTVTELQPTDNGLYDGNALPGAEKDSSGNWVYKGVTFDHSSKEIIVTVSSTSENGVEEIQYSVTGNNFSFTNSYAVSATATARGTKNITGREFKSGDEFTFKIEAVTSGAPMPANDTVTIKPSSGSRAAIDLGSFSFDQSDMTGAVKAQDSDTYTKVFEYTVTEQQGSAGGMTYDSRPKTFTITVTDNGEGEMSAQVDDDALVWTNEYATSTTFAGIDVEKTLTGRSMARGEFAFTITAENGTPAPDASDASFTNSEGRNSGVKLTMKKLSGLTFTQADAGKTFEYTVKETEGSLGGVTYDKSEYTVQIAVTDDGDGNISATTTITRTKDAAGSAVSEVVNAASFANSYRADPGTLDGTANLTVTKELTGRDWTGTDSFDFKLETGDRTTRTAVTDGDIVLTSDTRTVSGTANHSRTFGDITFKKTGEYIFKVSEVVPADSDKIPGVSYSGKVVTIKVTVTDPGTGTLAVSPQVLYGANLTFTNNYSTDELPVSGATYLNVYKNLTGRDWQPGDSFSFALSATGTTADKVTDGTVEMPRQTTISISSDNSTHAMAFGDITFHAPGTYTFAISETKGSITNITYDEEVRNITFVVVDNGEGKLVLAQDGYTVTPDEGLTFTNRYSLGDVSTTRVIDGSKTLTGKDWTDEQFTFTLTADDSHQATIDAIAAGNVIMPANTTATATKDNHNFTFDAITFKLPGTYQFKVTETNGGARNMTYDRSVKTVTISVVDNYDGTITAGETSGVDLTFNNTYTPTDPTATLSATKTLNGRDMAADEFEFTVTALGGAPAPTATTLKNKRAANGVADTLSFGTITFPKADAQYSYEVRETKGSLGGVTYDETVYTVTYTVAYDSARGVYNVTSTITADGAPATAVAFVNTYSASPATVAAFSGTKTYTDAVTGDPIAMTGGEFTFYVEAVTAGAPMPNPAEVTNGADGRFTFGAISFSQPGMYSYKVAERTPAHGGVSSNTQPYTVEIEVTDNGNGQLVANVLNGTDTRNFNFSNSYKAGEISSWVEVRKELTGRTMNAGEFEFTLRVADDATQTALDDGLFRFSNGSNSITATNDAGGSVKFGQNVLTFYADGTFNFRVSEVNKGDAHITYDTTVFDLSVTVSDDGNGNLSYEWTGMDSVVFRNTYTPTGTYWKPTATKTLTGRTMNAGEFEFVVEDNNGDIVSTGKNGADGSVDFTTVNYSQPGEFNYSIRETKGSLGGVEYDRTVYSAKVTVTDNAGQLVAAVEYSKDGAPIDVVGFENSYKAKDVTLKLGGSKTLQGRRMSANEFTFVIRDARGDEKYAYNDASGIFTFPEFTYSAAGEYVYTVTEQKGNLRNVDYDDTEYTVKVNVTDNRKGSLEATYKVYKGTEEVSGLTFTNYYRAEEHIVPPVTGDDRHIGMWAALLIASAAGLAGAVVTLKRKNSRIG